MPWTETALTVPAEVQERYPITTAALEAIGHIVGVIHRAELTKVPLQELLPIEDPLALRDRPVELIEAQHLQGLQAEPTEVAPAALHPGRPVVPIEVPAAPVGPVEA